MSKMVYTHHLGMVWKQGGTWCPATDLPLEAGFAFSNPFSKTSARTPQR